MRWLTIVCVALVALPASAAGEDEARLAGQPVRQLLDDLASTEARREAQAREHLLRAGSKALPHLRLALQSSRAPLRRAACTLLMDFGVLAVPLMPDVAELLADREPGIARAATRALGLIGKQRPVEESDAIDVTAIQRVVHRLRLCIRPIDAERARRRAPSVFLACLRIGAETQDLQYELLMAPRSLPERHPLVDLRHEADAPFLISRLLEHPSWPFRRQAIERFMVGGHRAKGRVDYGAVARVLARALDDPSEAVAEAALARLSRFARLDPKLGRSALVGFSSRHQGIRLGTVLAIGEQVPWSTKLERQLKANLRRDARASPFHVQRRVIDAQIASAWQLGYAPVLEPEAIDLLTRALEARVPDLRTAAARSLARHGHRPDVAVAPLVRTAGSRAVPAPYTLHTLGHRSYGTGGGGPRGARLPDISQSWRLLDSFGARGGRQLAKHIAGWPEDGLVEARWWALHALGELETSGPVGLRLLLDHEELEVRRRAALTWLARDARALDAVRVLLGALEQRQPAEPSPADEIVEEPAPDPHRVDWHRTALVALDTVPASLGPAVREFLLELPSDRRGILAPVMRSWLLARNQTPLPGE